MTIPEPPTNQTGNSSTTGDDKSNRAKFAAWGEFITQRGSRYEDCRFETFRVSNPAQAAAVEILRTFASDAVENGRAGNGLLLFGPCGSGKDHLLTATLRASISAGWFDNVNYPATAIQFRSGAELFADLRTGIAKETPERETLAPLLGCRLLVLSDVVQSGSALTEYQRQIVYRIVDHRYNHKRPVWMSVNAASRADLDTMLGRAIADRLIDGAVLVPCNWESFRRVKSPTTNGRAAG